ncbi:MAG: MFS transporter [Victivallales bacterium]|nr:MFS transporter [Victivallales bacterium]
MIIQGSFTEKLRRRSKKYYYLYNLLNGASYMCLGETVIILLALKLNCRDSVVSTLGAMMYYGYAILPFGKVLAARVGAASSQAVFWVARNFAALFVASSALWHHYGHPTIAMVVLLSGAFIFYGFRAAGIVLTQPLVGNITTPSERPVFLAINSAFFYATSLLALLAISFLLHFYDGIEPLVIIIIAGSILGFTSSYFIKNICETDELKKAASGPFLSGICNAIKNRNVRQQILSGMTMNLCISMIFPISMLTVKRGYGLSDKSALLYSIVQLVGSVLAAKTSVTITKCLGARKTLISIYCLVLFLALLWLFAPLKPHFYFIAPIFFLIGASNMAQNNAITNYFLQTIPVREQVNATILISTFSGFLGGLSASIIAGFTLDSLAKHLPDMLPINRYKLFFTIILLILAFGIKAFTRLQKPSLAGGTGR